MSFLTPAFLALAGIAGPIILLYMLRLRRREIPISSTLLWQRLMKDREANAPWQKLRRNLLLILQLLILAMLVLALGRPFIPVPSVAAGSVALLIDASASMSATDMPGGQSRFEVAQDTARQLVNELASNEVMTVIAAGPTPQVLTPPTNDRAALREAISQAEPTATIADWEAALALAGASIAGQQEPTIIILSDGGLPDDLPALPATISYIAIGQSADNLAITALATRALGDAPQLFAAVTNFSDQDADVIISFEVDGELHSAEALTIPAGQSEDLTITDLPDTTNVIRAELSAPAEGRLDDQLALDDVAYAVYTPPATGQLLLVTEGNLFLEQVFAAIPTLEGFRTPPGDLPETPFDLVIFDGWIPDELPNTNLLIINPPQTSELFTVAGTFENTRFRQQADDPILSFVDFEDIAVREAVLIQTPGWAQTLVEAEGGPLLLAGTIGSRRVAILTFDLHASDLPLKISYPILMANLLEWFAPARPFDAPEGRRPGETLVIRPQAATTDYRIVKPDGVVLRYEVEEEPLTFTSTGLLGVYDVQLLNGEDIQNDSAFAVNLFAPVESNIAPRETILIGEAEVTRGEEAERTGEREFWAVLAILAILILLIEWWVYHRGSMLPPRPERVQDGRRGLLVFGRRER
jgi:Ca-activated chloride channel family protein